MKFEIAYCFPAGPDHFAYAYRFMSSYLQFPPNVAHDTVILTDPGMESETAELFSLLPNVRAIATPDHAKDLSRYEYHVKTSTADCVMMLGGTAYCRRPGWGLRAITAFQRLGSQNLYGACGHSGAGPVHKHIRTTGWWGAPALLRRYPGWPRDLSGRYEMEHGRTCISEWVIKQGGQCWVVTFNGEWTLDRANDDPEGYGRGNHRSLLIGDRLCAPPFAPFP